MLRVCWDSEFTSSRFSVAFAEPARRRHFLLRIKLHAFLALHVQIAVERFVPAVEGKHRHRRRHADVDPDHAGFDAMLEFARGFAGVRENRCAVSVGRLVRHFDG